MITVKFNVTHIYTNVVDDVTGAILGVNHYVSGGLVSKNKISEDILDNAPGRDPIDGTSEIVIKTIPERHVENISDGEIAKMCGIEIGIVDGYYLSEQEEE